MEIYLDIELKQVRVKQYLVFKNLLVDMIYIMCFYMYYNVWKNNKMDFFMEIGCILCIKLQEEIDVCIWSWVEVIKVVDEVGNDLILVLCYV